MDSNISSAHTNTVFADIDFNETAADHGVPVSKEESTTSYITHQPAVGSDRNWHSFTGRELNSDIVQSIERPFEDDYDPFTTGEHTLIVDGSNSNSASVLDSQRQFEVDAYDPFATSEDVPTFAGKEAKSNSIQNSERRFKDDAYDHFKMSEDVPTFAGREANSGPIHNGQLPFGEDPYDLSTTNEDPPSIDGSKLNSGYIQNEKGLLNDRVADPYLANENVPTIGSTRSRYTLTAYVKLHNGSMMPQLHLGAHYAEQETHNAVMMALQFGYRGFDTSQRCSNIAIVGNAIREFIDSNFKYDGHKTGVNLVEHEACQLYLL